MSDLNCIENALTVTGWNRARITFLVRFLSALASVRTTNLTRIAAAFAGPAQIASNYERIRRFFAGFEFDEAELARLVVALAQQAGAKPPFVLSFDRTEWHFGKTPLNVLVVGIVYRGIAFPIVWNVLEKAGSSNTEERIAAIEKAVKIVGCEQVAFVVGDRDFASGELLGWLRKEKIGYRLRLRGDYLIADAHGKPACADWHFRHVPIDEERLCPYTGVKATPESTRSRPTFTPVYGHNQGRFGDTFLRAKSTNRLFPLLGFLQDADDLLIRELILFHLVSSPAHILRLLYGAETNFPFGTVLGEHATNVSTVLRASLSNVYA